MLAELAEVGMKMDAGIMVNMVQLYLWGDRDLIVIRTEASMEVAMMDMMIIVGAAVVEERI